MKRNNIEFIVNRNFDTDKSKSSNRFEITIRIVVTMHFRFYCTINTGKVMVILIGNGDISL